MNIEEIIREYIDKTVHMSLATVSGSKPWVCEVHFGYDDDLNLFFVSLMTARHCQDIANNPSVAGNIVAQHSLADSPHGIYFEGTAEMLASPSDEEIKIYCSRLERNPEELKANLAVKNGHRMYKILVENWAAFGKFGQDSNKKYELVWNGGAR